MKTRAERVRTFMRAHPDREFRMREIREACAPECVITTFGGTISSLTRDGTLTRIGRGVGNARFRWSGKPDQAKSCGRQTATAKKPPPPSKQIRDGMTGIAKRTRRTRTLGHADNFTAAPGTIDRTYCPKRLTSRVIAEDIAAFEARGGHIQRLGITKIFHDPNCADD